MFKGLTRPRRVVITGMGCVTPLGIGRAAFWDGLVTGKSGVRRIEAFDPSSSPVQIAAEVPSFDWQSQLNPKDRKHVPRTVPLALAAAREALEDAQLFPNDLSLDERRAIGVELGTGGGGLAFTEQQYEYWYVGPTTKASVYTIPASTHGGLSSELSMAFGLRGLSHIVSTGCTSSTDAMAYAAQHIALGRQDLMLSGGVDAPIAPGILAAFNLMTVLTSEWNDEPHRASRPFSRNRSGIVLGEGAWIYVLEELNHARIAAPGSMRRLPVMARPAMLIIVFAWLKMAMNPRARCVLRSRMRVANQRMLITLTCTAPRPCSMIELKRAH